MWSSQSMYLCLCIEDKPCSHIVTVPCPGSVCRERETERGRQVVKESRNKYRPGAMSDQGSSSDYLTHAGSPVLMGN